MDRPHMDAFGAACALEALSLSELQAQLQECYDIEERRRLRAAIRNVKMRSLEAAELVPAEFVPGPQNLDNKPVPGENKNGVGHDLHLIDSEDRLRDLLYSTSDYEEKKKIRAAIRELRRKKDAHSSGGAAMADVVGGVGTNASAASGSSSCNLARNSSTPLVNSSAPLTSDCAGVPQVGTCTAVHAGRLDEPAEAEVCGKGRQRPERLLQREAPSPDEVKKNYQLREEFDHKMNGEPPNNEESLDSHGQAPTIYRPLEDIYSMDGSHFVVLSLSFRPGSCQPEVFWYKDGMLLTSNEDFEQIVEETSCRLVIKELFPDDVGSYKCIIRNKFGEAESSARLIVEDNPSFKPPEFVIVPRDTTVEAGKSLEVHVEVQGSPDPVLSWFKGNTLLKSGKEFRQTLNAGLGTLLIYEVFPDDGGVYRCLASNAAGECEASFSVCVLARHVPNYSAPRLSALLEDLTVPDGASRVTLSCSLESRVTFATASWYKGSKKLRNSKDFLQTFDGTTATLVIAEIYPDDAGIYKCVLTVGNTELTTEAALTVTAGSSAEESCGESDADDPAVVRRTPEKSTASASTRSALAVGLSAGSCLVTELPSAGTSAQGDAGKALSAAGGDQQQDNVLQQQHGSADQRPSYQAGSDRQISSATAAHGTVGSVDDPVVPKAAPNVESSATLSQHLGKHAVVAASSSIAAAAEPAKTSGLAAARLRNSAALTKAAVPSSAAVCIPVSDTKAHPAPSIAPTSQQHQSEPDATGYEGGSSPDSAGDSCPVGTIVVDKNGPQSVNVSCTTVQGGSNSLTSDSCSASAATLVNGHRSLDEAQVLPVGLGAPADPRLDGDKPLSAVSTDSTSRATHTFQVAGDRCGQEPAEVSVVLRAGNASAGAPRPTADRTSMKGDSGTSSNAPRPGSWYGSTNGVKEVSQPSKRLLGDSSSVVTLKSSTGHSVGAMEKPGDGKLQPSSLTLRSGSVAAQARADRPDAPADRQPRSDGLTRGAGHAAIGTPLVSVSAKAELYRKAEKDRGDSAAPVPRPFVSTKLLSASQTQLAAPVPDSDRPTAAAAGGRLSPSPKAAGGLLAGGCIASHAKDGTVPVGGRVSPKPAEPQQQLQNGRLSPGQQLCNSGYSSSSSCSSSTGGSGGSSQAPSKLGDGSAAPALSTTQPRRAVGGGHAVAQGAVSIDDVDGSAQSTMTEGHGRHRTDLPVMRKPEAVTTVAASRAPVVSSVPVMQPDPTPPEKADANNNYTSITDENELQKILDKTDDFDERKKIRARIREVKEQRKAERDSEWRRREEERVAQERKRQAEAELAKKEKLEKYRELSKSSIGALPVASDEMAKLKISEADQEKKRLIDATHAVSTSTTFAGHGSKADEALKLKMEAAEKSKEAALKSYENVAKKEADSRKDQPKSGGGAVPVSLKPLDKKPASTAPASKPAGGKAAPATGKQALAAFKQMDKANNPNAGQSKPKFGGDSKLMQVADALLRWSRYMTRGYEHINIENYTTSWNDGMAFCALIHHFYPDAFDYSALDPKNRRHNFTLAFETAENRAGISALLDVEDMVRMQKPDWKCVLTYIQTFYSRIKELEDAKAQTPTGSTAIAVATELGSD